MQLPIAGCPKAWVFPVMGTLPNSSLSTFKMWRFAAELPGVQDAASESSGWRGRVGGDWRGTGLSDVDGRVPASLCVFISREDGFAQRCQLSRLHGQAWSSRSG